MNFPLKTLIVEDNDKELRVLISRLKPELFHVQKASSFKDAIKLIDNEPSDFDFSIFDILIGENTCYELIDKYGKEKFGIHAFTCSIREVNSVYWPNRQFPFTLRKPHNEKKVDELVEDLTYYLDRFDSSGDRPFYLPFPTYNGRLLPVPKKDIIYFKGYDDYSFMHFFTNQIATKKFISWKLKKVEEVVDKKIFIRIHRSYIISFLHLDYLLEKKEDEDWKISVYNRIRIMYKRFFSQR